MNSSLAAISASSYLPITPAASARAGNSGAGGKSGSSNGLSAEDQAAVDKLKARDREVRQHEQAHLAAAGGLAVSGASFTYQRGPDGKNYAIGGEVQIDTSSGRTPEETVQKAQQIRAAALAPADPSGQDQAVAAAAAQMAGEARAELAQRDSARNDRSSELGAAYGIEDKTSRFSVYA